MYFKIKNYRLIKFILRIIIYIYYCIKTHHRQPLTIPCPAPHLAPLPKGAGLRQGSLVSNTTIIRDTHNAPILQTISAARLRDRRPDYLHFHKHRQIRTTKIQILAEGAPQLFIIHYSLPICTTNVPFLYHLLFPFTEIIFIAYTTFVSAIIYHNLHNEVIFNVWNSRLDRLPQALRQHRNNAQNGSDNDPERT